MLKLLVKFCVELRRSLQLEGAHATVHGWLAYLFLLLLQVYNGDSEVLPQYVQGPRPAMDSLLNFPMYYQLINGFAKQGDLRE
jgi:hypothetical protein